MNTGTHPRVVSDKSGGSGGDGSIPKAKSEDTVSNARQESSEPLQAR